MPALVMQTQSRHGVSDHKRALLPTGKTAADLVL